MKGMKLADVGMNLLCGAAVAGRVFLQHVRSLQTGGDGQTCEEAVVDFHDGEHV